MNKKAQDMDILGSVGFIILVLMAVGATITGYVMGQRMGWEVLPLWQLAIIIVGEVMAAYVIVARG